MKVGSNLGVEFESRIGESNLGVKFESRIWVSNLGVKFGSQILKNVPGSSISYYL